LPVIPFQPVFVVIVFIVILLSFITQFLLLPASFFDYHLLLTFSSLSTFDFSLFANPQYSFLLMGAEQSFHHTKLSKFHTSTLKPKTKRHNQQ